jgi:hypothetical protein
MLRSSRPNWGRRILDVLTQNQPKHLSRSAPSHQSHNFPEYSGYSSRGNTRASSSLLARSCSSTTMATSDYQPPDKFEPQAPPMFNPFNSPPPGDVQPHHDVHGALNDRKRKRQHPDHSSVDFSHHGGFNSPNSPVQSNPDLDSYIKSRRKPREKKACQVCR